MEFLLRYFEILEDSLIIMAALAPAVPKPVAISDPSNYEALLVRAYAAVPARKQSDSRFEVPQADVLLQGVKTYVKNFEAIAVTIRRTPEELAKYLYRELAVPGAIEGARLALNGRFASKTINDKVAAYVASNVICRECGKPDTHIEGSSDRSFGTLVCEACGARRPIRK